MSSRAFFYGFLGCIAIASVVTLVSDPLNPRIGDGALECGDWSAAKLKLYLVDNGVPFAGDASRSTLVRLVHEHQRQCQRQRSTTSGPAGTGTRTGQSSSDAETQAQRDSRDAEVATESQPLLSGGGRSGKRNETDASVSERENERLLGMSNLR